MGRLRTVLAVAEGVWNVVWTAFHDQWEGFLDVIGYLLNIFRHIYPGVIAFTAEAAVVAAINKSGHKLTLDSTPIMILSTLVSFVLTQNVGGSNLKFQASRAEWSKIVSSVRQIAILLQHVEAEGRCIPGGDGQVEKIIPQKPADPEAEHTKMVRNAMKLLTYFPKALQEGLEGRASEGFSFARRASVKLQQGVSRLLPSSPCVLSRRACGTRDEDIVLPPAKASASTLNDTTGADDYADTDVARQILTWLSGYINRLARLEHIRAPVQTLALQSVSNLQNSASSLHRAATTPNPAPYTFHLKMSIWAFLLFLPLQQYSNLGWWIVAVQFVVALVYLGFIQVGIVVANPFTPGTGKNGKALLPMDQMAGRIEAQLEKITGFNIDHVIQDLDLPEAPDMQRIMAIIEREAQNRAQAAHHQGQQAAAVSGQAAELQPVGASNPPHADDAISEKNLDMMDEVEAAPRHAFEGHDADEGSSGVVQTVVLR